ncbi:hypothetical protein K3N28_16030 [Glycomyces sp. TRM65418]|uniref:hypothetical protein n=1 Tax=Glycomyces sp. TRM65418 TaxID=2867006 RepID=UPI001CE51C4E|nr:hypothetical protein [Glycomyces sp. TRM65418]MCC3764570.1 hypothetical protein [Glycomyces sp. TRM65418]QZD54236.1 hypothetical protein K3N28_15945 [Glycomyces sp. TRM65418]
MSSDTAAQPPQTASRQSPRPTEGHAPADDPKRTDARPPEHPGPPDRSSRVWAWATAGAAIAFCAALAFGAMRLYVDVGEVADSPERTVDAFLEALLDQRDADAAAAWLCEDKSDRDLSEAVAALSYIDDAGEFRWGDVAETGRSVGAATVTADIRVGSGDDTFSSPTTWEFSLVAEQGEPQWLICSITAE